LKKDVKGKTLPEIKAIEQLWYRKSYFTLHVHINETQTAETLIECPSMQVQRSVYSTQDNGKAIKDQNCFSQSLMHV